MRELPVALSTLSNLDDPSCAGKHTLSSMYTHRHNQRQRGTETESVCAVIVFAQGSENAPESVDRHLQFSSNTNVLLYAITIRAVSGLVFSHEARSEIWL